MDAVDEEGKELADLNAAKANALNEAREMIQASVAESGKIDLRHYIEVRNDTGDRVFRVRFEDAVTVRRGDEILSPPPA